ncbi:hypothetical protein VWZ88_01765 [Phaeobacter sp. JH20_36]|uniref:hypothetical protein n=1 Tax=unclassified Phaeobacter TaxID=2621772 RepID=UPI003A83BC85
MSPHSDPETHGVQFGRVVVTVDAAMGDCIVIAPQPGPICTSPKRMRLNSLDEIRGAYRTQSRLAARVPDQHPHAKDIASALEFAGKTLSAAQGAKHQPKGQSNA